MILYFFFIHCVFQKDLMKCQHCDFSTTEIRQYDLHLQKQHGGRLYPGLTEGISVLWIRFILIRIRILGSISWKHGSGILLWIRLKVEKYQLFDNFFSSDYPKMIYYNINIRNIKANEYYFLIMIFYVFKVKK